MATAVRFNRYGDVEVLDVVDIARPMPGPGQVSVRVEAAGINPGEAKVRAGTGRDRWPVDFPSGQGSDLAGTVDAVGPGVEGFSAGDDVVGFSEQRSSQASYVVVPATNLVPKPANVSWDVAGSLYVAGTTAYATVAAVGVRAGDMVVVSGASGGVGTIAVQLARLRGASVIGLASEGHHRWLEAHGVTPVDYHGPDLAARIREAAAATGGSIDAFIDAFIDTVGGNYVELAFELGVLPERIDTIVDFSAPSRYGVKADGQAAAASASVLGELVRLVSEGQLDVPIAHVYPLAQVRDAYRELATGHTHGKIVLHP